MSASSKGPSYLEFTDRHGVRRAKARVPLGNGKYRDISLGRYGTPESRAKFREIQDAWEKNRAAGSAQPCGLTVIDLVAAFMVHADQHYRDADGKHTSEFRVHRETCRPLLKLHGKTAARDFGPLALKAVRTEMVRLGWVRKSINLRIGRIKRMWQWGAAEQLLPAAAFHELQTVSGLAQGRSQAPDRPEIPPAPPGDVGRACRKMEPMVKAMVLVQLLTGMRPGEICRLRGDQIDRQGPQGCWVSRPKKHKTAWRGHRKAVVIGPRAQRLLQPYLDAAGDNYLFRYDRFKHSPHIAVSTYQHKISAACTAAGVEPWSPNRLRHSAGTAAQHAGGLDAARAVLGHRDAQTTMVYAAHDLKKAAEVMKKIG